MGYLINGFCTKFL